METRLKEKQNCYFVRPDPANPADRDHIRQKIKESNDAVSTHHRETRRTGWQTLDIFIRDQQDRLVGGLLARIYWGWLYIDELWIDQAWRGRGYGRELMTLAEKEARARGCTRAHLKTFSFQARQFYEKHGYRVVGQLDDYPPGESFFWLRKDFSQRKL